MAPRTSRIRLLFYQRALARSRVAIVGRPGIANARGEVTLKKPHRHFEMAEPARLPAARVKSALHGGADFHVLKMKRGELLSRLGLQFFKIRQCRCFRGDKGCGE